jgi:hypothetical protein
MKYYITLAWNWLVYSSADPKKVSLSVKGALTVASSFIIGIVAIFGVGVSNDDIANIIEAISLVVEMALVLFGAVMSLIGLVRKVYRTIKGEHLGIIYR